MLIARIHVPVGCFENSQQVADTKRTHQKRHARRLATRLRSFEPSDLLLAVTDDEGLNVRSLPVWKLAAARFDRVGDPAPPGWPSFAARETGSRTNVVERDDSVPAVRPA